MTTCPHCAVFLEVETYENFQILRCPQCNGHLIDCSRYESIKRIPKKTLTELENEARKEFKGDTSEPIRCPRCHIKMLKMPLPAPGFDLHFDLCSPCHLIWLDGGELAMAQLAHQASPAFRQSQKRKQRAAELEADPKRRAALDNAISKLPQTVSPFTGGFREAIFDALLRHPTSSYFGIRL